MMYENTSHVEKLYNPPESMQEMRAKGLPWVVATCMLVLFVVFAIVLYFVVADELSAEFIPNTAEPSIGYEVEFLLAEVTPTSNILTNLSTPEIASDVSEAISTEWPPPLKTSSRSFLHAAVACSNEYCAEIGRDILIHDGNAVDAAIASVVCMGAINPHATGFGGGILMLVHDRVINETALINAVSTAPRSATEETYLANRNLAKLGYSSIGTPGFLHGIWTAYKRFGSGRIAWQDLLLPTIDLLEKGFAMPLLYRGKRFRPQIPLEFSRGGRIVSAVRMQHCRVAALTVKGYPVSLDFVASVRSRNQEIVTEKSMSSAFPIVMEGTVLRDPVHLHFLRRIATAREPLHLFYRGEIANQMISEMKQRGGLLTKADLAGYESKIETPLSVPLPNGFTIVGPGQPSSFSAIGLITEIMTGRYLNQTDSLLSVNYLRDLLMAQQLGMVRLEQTGDPDFVINDPILIKLDDRLNNSVDDSNEDLDEPDDIKKLLWNLVLEKLESKNLSLISLFFWNNEDFVGSHINVIDKGGMAVSLSSTINDRFGSVRRFEKGGFVWNNAMTGFTINDREDSEDMHVNSVEGRKRPRTTMAPFMLFDHYGHLVGCFGTTGSLNSILAAAQALLNQIIFNMSLVRSVDAPRIFATSEGATFESGFPLATVSELEKGMSLNPTLLMDAVVHTLQHSANNTLQAVCDFRGDAEQCARGF